MRFINRHRCAMETTTAEPLSPAMLMHDLLQHHVADNVELLNTLSDEEAAELIARVPPERAVEILDQPEFYKAPEIIQLLPPDRAAALLTGMSADRAADVVHLLENPAGLLARLDPETKASIEKLLVYPTNTAGSIMTTEFVSVPSTWTVEQTLQHIRQVERTRETVYAIYVLDPQTKCLIHAVPLRRLISAQPDAPILSAARSYAPITTSPLTDREDVARLFRKYDLLAVPVVDTAGRMLGIVTVDDAIDAMLEESTEDVQKFGGVLALEKPYMQIGFAQMIGKRAGWLCALFLSEMLTASAMQHFRVRA